MQLVDDVEPYELMKLRLLNGSHQAMCYFAYLAGYRLVHEAAQDPLFQAFLLGYMDCGGHPDPAPGARAWTWTEYKHTLIERFSNPQVRDTIARLCAQSSDRIPKWLLPVIRQQLATGGEIRRSAAVVASWARYAEGIDEQGEPIEVVDRLADSLTQLARRQREDPDAFIANRACSGTSPTTSVSSPPTGPRWPRCTSAGHGRRWSHWSDDRTGRDRAGDVIRRLPVPRHTARNRRAPPMTCGGAATRGPRRSPASPSPPLSRASPPSLCSLADGAQVGAHSAPGSAV